MHIHSLSNSDKRMIRKHNKLRELRFKAYPKLIELIMKTTIDMDKNVKLQGVYVPCFWISPTKVKLTWPKYCGLVTSRTRNIRKKEKRTKKATEKLQETSVLKPPPSMNRPRPVFALKIEEVIFKDLIRTIKVPSASTLCTPINTYNGVEKSWHRSPSHPSNILSQKCPRQAN